ncbi:formate dehydrogenase subunit alpha [Pelagibius litoralis]|uniref:Formate dehydrogenase subunit alpha n=1 Tax=Pelagibius litoralis TaxID=374515 RepID=A0A967EXI8_9PROT|nr:formate dehydrogenase subunit alpha [Pelagibius litoralis]NIA69230.1 formate dehydrogenase subunit alpha [Pelagibius litoralis]
MTALPQQEAVRFTLDGHDIEAAPGETIWAAAARYGTKLPHLCYSPEPGYRADGNCRACMVEIEGERVLAASCIREPREGMVVKSASERAEKARALVFELLVADQPKRETSHDPASKFWNWASDIGVTESRFPAREVWAPDVSHPAMAVNLDACINCNLCVRACREVQVNDVIGMAFRGHGSKVIFDFDDPMGESTCVACGECVQACPTGALMESSLLDEQGTRVHFEDRSVDTLCPYCGVGCQTTVHVKDDKILYIDGRDGPANQNRLCVKGRFGWDYIYNPQRLTKPLIRRDDAPKRWDDQVDPMNPSTHFREATWEEALDRAAGGLKKVYEETGPAGLAGFGSAKGSNEEAYLFQKLIRTAFHTNNVDHCTRLCHASSVAALMEGIGSGAVTAPFTAAKDSDCMIIIGARPAQNHPVAATFLKNAAKRGAKIVVMDPRGQQMNRYAYKHLQFKPGRDVALLNAMIHTIIEEGLTDQQYIQAHTSGFEELKTMVQDFSPEAMEEVCGIDAASIRDVARLYARSERSIIFWGMGISQHVHGTDNARCLIALTMITGQIGRPGTGLHPLRGQNNVQGASDAGLIPMVFPDYKSVETEEVRKGYEEFWGTELDPKRGLTVVEIVDAIIAGQIKGMYIMGENPAMSDPDQAHARKALAKLEHLVVQDIFMTETAWHADVILPASAHAEKWGSFTNTNREVQVARPVAPPPGEARQDWELIQDLANRLGLNWTYSHPSDVFTEMVEVMPSLKNISWARLVREDAVTYPVDGPDIPGNEILFAEGFPTSDGRAKIVPAGLVPPDELPDDNYPLVLTTGRMLEHWHTGAMTRRASVLDTLEPEAIASLNPRQLSMMGLVAGDSVKVSTRRGEIALAVRADRDVPEGMVFIPFCFNEAAANMLTNPQLDPFGKIPEFKFCAAKVEKIEAFVAAE